MPIPAAEPISRAKTSEVVLATLRGWIVDGVLAPEETLRDVDLAAAFGVSRTPVREALLRLEREGLIESQPGRWTRVTPLDTAELARVYPVWIELEALAARLAAGMPELGDALPAIAAAQRDFAAAVERAVATPGPENSRAARDGDAAFHDAIVTATGNRFLADALQPLKAAVRRYENVYFANAPLVGRRSAIDHERIVTALRDRDPDAAAAATRRNMERTWELLDRLPHAQPSSSPAP